MEIVFVASTGGNLFMAELVELLSAELCDAGIASHVAFDAFPAGTENRYVVVPHEYYDTRPETDWPSAAQLARTVALVTEQPGTVWFNRAADRAAQCGAIADISEVGRVELRRRGLAAEHLQLGYSRHWDRWHRDDRARDLDIVFMGSVNRRRDVHLSSYADVLSSREARLILAPIAPKVSPGPGFVAGEKKRDLLAGAKIALNVRSQIPRYFEWVRAIEAIINGAVLVTEHGAGHGPLRPGEHFLSGRPESLALLAEGLLRDPDRAAGLRRSAYEHLRDAVPLRPSVLALAELAGSLSGPHRAAPPPAAPADPPAIAEDEPAGFAPRTPDFDDPAAAPVPAVAPEVAMASARRALLAAVAARRDAQAELVRVVGGDPDARRVVFTSEAWEGAEPRVTVAIPCFRHGAEAVHAIASAAAQTLRELEVVILDDASDDDSAAAVAGALAARPWLASRLLRREVNRGLAAARNALLEVARARSVLMLDADNTLFPRAAERLLAALDADPEASFAYGILAVRRDGRPDGLLSYRGWDPAHLATDNPVDALALLDRDRIRDLGGYLEDDELHGWEDYELWCRVAAAGGHGAHVPNIVAIYTRAPGSMVSISDLDQPGMRAALRRRHPSVFDADPSRTLPGS